MQALLQDYLVINSAGLALDILGAALLAVFGLPNAKAVHDLLFPGTGALLLEETEAGSPALVRRHQRWGRVGLASLILGFALQLVSNAVQRHWLGLPWW